MTPRDWNRAKTYIASPASSASESRNIKAFHADSITYDLSISYSQTRATTANPAGKHRVLRLMGEGQREGGGVGEDAVWSQDRGNEVWVWRHPARLQARSDSCVEAAFKKPEASSGAMELEPCADGR